MTRPGARRLMALSIGCSPSNWTAICGTQIVTSRRHSGVFIDILPFLFAAHRAMHKRRQYVIPYHSAGMYRKG